MAQEELVKVVRAIFPAPVFAANMEDALVITHLWVHIAPNLLGSPVFQEGIARNRQLRVVILLKPVIPVP